MSRTTLPLLEIATLAIVLFACVIAVVPGADSAVVSWIDQMQRVDATDSDDPDGQFTPRSLLTFDSSENRSSDVAPDRVASRLETPLRTNLRELVQDFAPDESETTSTDDQEPGDWELTLESQEMELDLDDVDTQQKLVPIPDLGMADVIHGQTTTNSPTERQPARLKFSDNNSLKTDRTLELDATLEYTPELPIGGHQENVTTESMAGGTADSKSVADRNPKIRQSEIGFFDGYLKAIKTSHVVRNQFVLPVSNSPTEPFFDAETNPIPEDVVSDYKISELPNQSDPFVDPKRKPMTAPILLTPGNSFRPRQ